MKLTPAHISQAKKALTGPKAGITGLLLAIGTFLAPESQTVAPPEPSPQTEFEFVDHEERELANGKTMIIEYKIPRQIEEIPEVVDLQEQTAAAEGHIDGLANIISEFLVSASEKPLQTLFFVAIVVWIRLTNPPKKSVPPEKE